MKSFKCWLLFLTLVCFLPSTSLALSVNDGIYINTALNTRATPSTSGTLLATIPVNTIGVVVDGPVVANGYTWWKVSWTYGSPLITGWSIQDGLNTSPPNPIIYDDYIRLGWHNLAWPNMSSNYFSSTKRSGTYGIQATASAAYARLYTRTTIGFNTGGQQTLRLSLMNPTSGNGQRLYVALYNTSGVAIHYLPAWQYVAGGSLATNTWYDLVIPIADLWATNQTVGGVVIETEVASTFFVDNVSFSTTSGSTYWSAPSTVTSVTVSCSPISVQTSSTSQCSASVSGTGNYSSAVSWGASAGSINSSGLFTAPSSVPNSAGVAIVAISNQDPTKSGNATVTVTTPVQISQASADVFTEALGTGWNIGGWPQVYVNTNSEVASNSNYGIRSTISTPNYGRLQIKSVSNYKFNTTGYGAVSFEIFVGGYDDKPLYVGLINSSGAVSLYLPLASVTLEHQFVPYQWQLVTIPLASLNATNIDVYGIEIQSDTPTTFTIDNVKFKTIGECI